MKFAALYLVLGVLPAFGGSREPPVRLYVQFQHQPPDAVLDAIRAELQEIMLPSGMDLDWRSLDAARGDEVSSELVVVHFKGTCGIDNLEPFDGYPGPLGWTHISDGEILPFSDVNCDGVRIFIQRDLLRFPEEERPAAYGRALARVLAHELYHVFAKTRKHSSTGVAKAAYSVHDLLALKLRLEKPQCDLLRASHSHGANSFSAGQ
ncbi:MAG: hypothetical protein LAP40_18075 [Acidobacteriia bacterium]|nr:hypothetical protein [Terriglobia bacterium]